MNRISMNWVRDQVALVTGFSAEQLDGPRRTKELAGARHLAMFLMRSFSTRPNGKPPTLKMIGIMFGGRDHTTVMHGINQARVLIATDDQFAIMAADIIHRARDERRPPMFKSCRA